MSDLIRLRELAALFQPKREPVVESKTIDSFDAIKEIVNEALEDLDNKIGDTGALYMLVNRTNKKERSHKAVSRFAGIVDSVQDAVEDLTHKLGEDGALETLMSKSGLIDLDKTKDADGLAILKRLAVRTKQFDTETKTDLDEIKTHLEDENLKSACGALVKKLSSRTEQLTKELDKCMDEIEIILASDKQVNEDELTEAVADKRFCIVTTRHRDDRQSQREGTLAELIDAFSYTLEKGASYAHEKGNKKIDRSPKTPAALVTNLNNAENNGAANGYAGTSYELGQCKAAVKEDLDEMAQPKEFQSGAVKSAAAKEMVKAFRKGEESFELKNGEKYVADKALRVNALEAGQIVFASYDSTNQGAELVQVLGFNDGTGDTDEVQCKSVKELLAQAKAAGLKDIDDAHMVVKDLEDGSSGGYYYQYQGRFARGSGAEKLTFTLVKKV